MSLVYLASPYSHPDPAVVEERFDAVCRAAAYFMERGRHIYSPIAHTHPIAMRGNLPTGWDYWREYDEAIISRCSELWVLCLDGYDTSAGVSAECDIARSFLIPVRYVNRYSMEFVGEDPACCKYSEPIYDRTGRMMICLKCGQEVDSAGKPVASRSEDATKETP